jgi:hypothetical protein
VYSQTEKDESGKITKECIKKDESKVCTYFKYDTKGKLIEKICKVDKENDGKFDYVLQLKRKYDFQGRKIEEVCKLDKENDGKFDYAEQVIWKYDNSEKEKMIISIDVDGDGIFDKVVEE